MHMPKKVLYPILIFAAVIIYILTLKGAMGNPTPEEVENGLDQNAMSMELSPERGRYALVMSLVSDHSFALSETLAKAVYPDIGYYNGRYYIYFVPGLSLLAVPLYIWGYQYQMAQVFTFFLPAIFAVLNGVFIYQICRKVFKQPVWAGLFSALVFCFGSTSWSYAVTLYQHQTTTFFLLSAFYAVWKFREKTRMKWIYPLWVWTCLGLTLTLDYPNALFMAPVMIYFAFSAFEISKKAKSIEVNVHFSAIVTSVVFLGLVILHGFYNYTHFGNPWRVSGSLPGTKLVTEAATYNTPERASLVQLIEKKKDVVKFFSEEKFPNGLFELTASSDRGLLIYSPIFILGFAGLVIYLKRYAGWEVSTLTACVLAIFFLYSSWGDPWGGWAFGPRYLIPAMGILSIFVSGFLTESKKYIFKTLAFGLFVYSSAVSLLGVLTTNAIPPKSEAIILKTGYNFLRSWEFFQDSRSSSFVYNTWFSHLPLWLYALPIYLLVIAAAGIFLFRLSKDKTS